MYDYINNEQVKCFGTPLYYGVIEPGEFPISTSHGSLISYKNGDQVPTKTTWRNYPKNMIILDTEPENDPDVEEESFDELLRYIEATDKIQKKEKKDSFCLHIIQNGIVVETIYNNIEAASVYFIENELFLNYYGEELNIKTADEILLFIKETKLYKKTIESHSKNINKNFRKLMKINHFSIVDPFSKEYQNYIRKQNIYIKNLDIARNAMLNKTNKITEQYLKKWYITNSKEKEILFGSFLEVLKCFAWKEKNSTEMSKKFYPKLEQDYKEAKELFKNFRKDNPGIKQSYIAWFEK